jgi:hypothetical protein
VLFHQYSRAFREFTAISQPDSSPPGLPSKLNPNAGVKALDRRRLLTIAPMPAAKAVPLATFLGGGARALDDDLPPARAAPRGGRGAGGRQVRGRVERHRPAAAAPDAR